VLRRGGDVYSETERKIETLGGVQRCVNCRLAKVHGFVLKSRMPSVSCAAGLWSAPHPLIQVAKGLLKDIRQGADCPMYQD